MRINDVVAEYVAYKRAIGMRFDTDASILGSFCRHMGDVPLSSISADQVRTYLDGNTPVSSYWQRKYTAISGLYRYALPRGYVRASPLPSHHPQCPPPLVLLCQIGCHSSSIIPCFLYACWIDASRFS